MPTAKTIPRAASAHLLRDTDLSPEEHDELIRLAVDVKASPGSYRTALDGKAGAMLFEKPSLRTRVTFDLALRQLGADSVYQDHRGDRIGEREPARDMARNLDRWFQVIVARTYSQSTLDELARWSSAPVINALSGGYHPCQAMADYLTFYERFGGFKGKKLAYIGDGNNVAHSLLLTGAALGVDLAIGGPEGYQPDAEIVSVTKKLAEASGSNIEITSDPAQAVAGASAVYTDVWTSMGWEEETQRRHIAFQSFQVDDALMAKAGPEAIFMHCLPALRGQEVTDAVIESPQSAVFDQAENRLHAQKALLLMLMSGS